VLYPTKHNGKTYRDVKRDDKARLASASHLCVVRLYPRDNTAAAFVCGANKFTAPTGWRGHTLENHR
jgi:hypothetical protein